MISALVDSNVIVAALALEHVHHEASIAVFMAAQRRSLAIAAHSHAEVYNTLTREGLRAPFGYGPEQVWAALLQLRRQTVLLGLTAAETFDAVGDFARSGGVGPRLYDRLIGQVAVAHRVPFIVTWNIGHMTSLFPALKVATPTEALAWLG